MKSQFRALPLLALLTVFSAFFYSNISIAAEAHFKPFILAQTIQAADLKKAVTDTKDKLAKAGFETVGEYTPFSDTHIIVVTSPALKQYATQSENGVYGAIQRVSVTVTDGATQISFTNPTYMAHVYRFKTDLADVTKSLKDSLGFVSEYGSEEGLTKDELRDYQYKMFMPDFTDRLELAEYSSQEEALASVLKALKKNDGGVSKIYQVDLDGKEETVIGVSMAGNGNSDCSSDQYIMGKIDFKKVKSSGHLPYEIIVKNGAAYALFAEFRIALSFPDLSMMGSNSFASIMCAPGTIKEALTLAAGGNPDD